MAVYTSEEMEERETAWQSAWDDHMAKQDGPHPMCPTCQACEDQIRWSRYYRRVLAEGNNPLNIQGYFALEALKSIRERER